MTPDQVLEFARTNEVQFVDLRYMDFPAVWRHETVPIEAFGRAAFDEGVASACAPVDGLLRKLLPVPVTAHLDPLCQHPTLALICEVQDPATGTDWLLSSRAVAKRAAAVLANIEFARRAEFGVDLEFFILDQASFEQGVNGAHYRVDSREAYWRRGRDEPDNLGTQIDRGEGPGCIPPQDSLHNLRSEMAALLAECGIRVDRHAHGRATGGQAVLRLHPEALLEMGEKVVTAKYVIRNVAARHGKVVTFMPQPLYGEAGSGMPVRLTLWNGTQNIFQGPGGADFARWAVGGLSKHLASMLAFTCPTTNSYRRLVAAFPSASGPDGTVKPSSAEPGDSSFVRMHDGEIEFDLPDALCDPYLAFSAIALAVLAGLRERVEPTSAAAALPAALDEALAALLADHAYLLQDGVFGPPLISAWARSKLEREILPLRDRPHPFEFVQYFAR